MMDTIITLSIFCLSFFSLVVYLKPPGNLIVRAIKGIVAFFASLISTGAYITGDYATVLIIVPVVSGLSVRRLQLTKTNKPALSRPDPMHSNGERSNSTKVKKAYTEKKSTAQVGTELKNIAFSYTDSNGSSSYREVDTKKVDEDYITGYCHLRRRLRTFRLDRIADGEVVIRDSGEVLNVDDWVIQLYQ